MGNLAANYLEDEWKKFFFMVSLYIKIDPKLKAYIKKKGLMPLRSRILSSVFT